MSKKIVSLVVAGAVVFALTGVSVARAEDATTVAQLQQMIADLQKQIASLTAGGSATTVAGGEITKNLTVGSKGDEVNTLQQFLIDEGYLKITAPTGYFGKATKAAVAAWQKDAGLPSTGYFGALSRAEFAKNSTPVTPVVTPTSTPSTSTPVGISTPGAEGTLSVEKAASPASGVKLYEGDAKASILGLKVKATGSDIDVQRVKLDIGSDTKFYNKFFTKVGVYDGDTLLAETDLNSSTVSKESGEYYVTLTGFHFVVAKDQTKYLTIKGNVYGTIDSAYDNTSYSVSLANNGGVRGVDGAGLNETAGDNTITNSFILNKSQSTQATLTISADTSTPDEGVVVSDSNGTADYVTALNFKAAADKDSIKITDLYATATESGTGAASVSTVYLYDGSTLISSAAANSSGVAHFTNLDTTVSKDSSKVYTIKLRVDSAATTDSAYTVTVAAANAIAENSVGDSVSGSYLTGSAVANAVHVYSVAPVLSLVSAGLTSITRVQGTDLNTSSSTAIAKFDVKLTANGGDITLAPTGAFGITLYKDNASTTSGLAAIYDRPSTGTSLDGSSNYVISKGNTAEFVVTYTINGAGKTSGQWDARMSNLTFNTDKHLTYMPNIYKTDKMLLP